MYNLGTTKGLNVSLCIKISLILWKCSCVHLASGFTWIRMLLFLDLIRGIVVVWKQAQLAVVLLHICYTLGMCTRYTIIFLMQYLRMRFNVVYRKSNTAKVKNAKLLLAGTYLGKSNCPSICKQELLSAGSTIIGFEIWKDTACILFC